MTKKIPMKHDEEDAAPSTRESIIPLAVSSLSEAETPVKVELRSSVGEDEDAAVLPSHQMQHSCIDNLYIMLGPKQRVYPNIVATNIDNELFHGKMLLMFRTTPDKNVVQPSENPFLNHFKGKQRRFEFQWQFKLKNIPEGGVFFCAELDNPIHLNVIQRAVINTALKFVKKMNKGFSYYISESHDYPSYSSFPVGTSMDRFTVSKPGEPLPELGRDIIEDEATMKERKRGKTIIEWNTDDVYTMSLWSAYLDWTDWQLMNFPGIPKIDITSLVGIQPIKLNLFTTPGVSGPVAGKDVKRHIVKSIEISNVTKSTLGKGAMEWVKARGECEQISSIELPEQDLDLGEESTDLANVVMSGTFDSLPLHV